MPLLRCRGGSCSDGWCPCFLETPPSPVFRPHGPSLRACWWVQALERATGHGGLRDSRALDPEAGGHSVGSGAGPATLPSSCLPLSLVRCSEALETRVEALLCSCPALSGAHSAHTCPPHPSGAHTQHTHTRPHAPCSPPVHSTPHAPCSHPACTPHHMPCAHTQHTTGPMLTLNTHTPHHTPHAHTQPAQHTTRPCSLLPQMLSQSPAPVPTRHGSAPTLPSPVCFSRSSSALGMNQRFTNVLDS